MDSKMSSKYCWKGSKSFDICSKVKEREQSITALNGDSNPLNSSQKLLSRGIRVIRFGYELGFSFEKKCNNCHQNNYKWNNTSVYRRLGV